MKQKVNPIVFVVCLVLVGGVLVVIGKRVFGPPPITPPSKEETAAQAKTINGVKVPPGVPSDYWERNEGGKGQAEGSGQSSSK